MSLEKYKVDRMAELTAELQKFVGKTITSIHIGPPWTDENNMLMRVKFSDGPDLLIESWDSEAYDSGLTLPAPQPANAAEAELTEWLEFGFSDSEKMMHRKAGGTFVRNRDGVTREGRWRDGSWRFE